MSEETITNDVTMETQDTDPFDELDSLLSDDEPEDASGGETDTPPEGESAENAGQDKEQPPERTSKQSPEFDAVAAELRRTKAALTEAAEKARKYDEHEQWVKNTHNIDNLDIWRQKVEQATFQTKYDQMWNNAVIKAQNMKAAGWDDTYINNFLETSRENIALQQRIDSLEQNLNKTVRQNEQITQQQQAAQNVKNHIAAIRELQKQYSDIIPELPNVNEDIPGLQQILDVLPPEMVRLMVQNRLPAEQAFKLACHDKLTKREKSLTEKRTVANIADRSKKTVETNKDEPKPEDVLTPFQRSISKLWGLPMKEVAKNVNPKLKKGVK